MTFNWESERITVDADDLIYQYRMEIKWSHCLRVSSDSQLLLLTLHRLLSRIQVLPTPLRSLSLYVGSRYGAIDNYTSFDNSISRGRLRPMAYAYAHPSISLACASLAMSLIGSTYTVMGNELVGIDAARQAAFAIASGQIDKAVIVTTSTPVDPRDGMFDALAFIMTPMIAEIFRTKLYRSVCNQSSSSSVDILDAFLSDIKQYVALLDYDTCERK